MKCGFALSSLKPLLAIADPSMESTVHVKASVNAALVSPDMFRPTPRGLIIGVLMAKGALHLSLE